MNTLCQNAAAREDALTWATLAAALNDLVIGLDDEIGIGAGAGKVATLYFLAQAAQRLAENPPLPHC